MNRALTPLTKLSTHTKLCKPSGTKAKLWIAKVLAEGGKPPVCKPKGTKAKLWFAKVLAEGGKTSRRRRQNYSPYKAKLCKAFASLTKQSFVSFVQAL
ncbi:hypothetical protein EON73_00095 [bacterium]|nr:MAG: hypothetical protein EON73_00095 [bacterium]